MATYKEIIDSASMQMGHYHYQLVSDSHYYEATVDVSPLGNSMPPEMRQLNSNVGWARLYLDSLVERIEFTGFRYLNTSEADEQLQDWWEVNELSEEAALAHLEAFIHGRCYVTVSAPDRADVLQGHPDDAPLIHVESPKYMWAELDPRTRRVEWAVRFYNAPSALQYRTPQKDQRFTIYLPDRTVFLRADGYGNLVEEAVNVHNLGIVPVIPFFNRERVSDRHGRSEIIPELRSAQDAATRVMMNLQAASELMAVPQRMLFGVAKSELDPSGGTDPYAKYRAYMANFLTFSNPDAKAQQLASADLSNYTTALQEISKQVASYTGLPPQYLSFNSDNPASAEAIRSSESRLVKKCELKGRMFGNDWEQVMRIAMLVMNNDIPAEAFRMEAILADPSTPTWAAKADAAQKLVGGKPIIPVKQARIDLGYTPEMRRQMEAWDEEEADELANAMLGRPSARFPLPTDTSAQNSSTAEEPADSA